MSTNDGIGKKLLGWIPDWVGFGLIILAGLVAIGFGAFGKPTSIGLIAFGVAAIASAILAWVNGGTSTPKIDPFGKSFGGTVDNIDGWAWLVVFGLFVVALAIALVEKYV